MTQTSRAIGRMQRVAAIATMASRIETFKEVLPTIHQQVDHMFVYLDGYGAPPDFLGMFDRITVSKAEDLHVSSRLLCIQQLSAPAVVVIVDDDIIYPPDYVSRLVVHLQRLDGKAIVGVHGRIFRPPYESYLRDATMMHFTHRLFQRYQVHELGVGTCAFISSNFDIDPREWDRCDINDITVAIEAERRGLKRVVVPRRAGWLKAYAENQPDSLYRRTLNDESEQTRQMRFLLGL